MDTKTKAQFFSDYQRRTHRIGRSMLSVAFILLALAPFAMGFILDTVPDMSAFWRGIAQISAIYIPSCIVEFLIYTPMLGAGGSYLAFITGNLINMKIPCALNARDIADTKAGTAENDIVSTLAIATSSLVTTLVLAVGVLLLIPLRPVLESPALQPAFNNVVPALFGAMATRYFRKGKKLVAIPLTLMTLLFVFAPGLISSVGTLMILSGVLAIGQAFLMFKRAGKKAQDANEVPR